MPRRVFDYQFVGAVAVVLFILTRGALLPTAVVTSFVAGVLLLCDAAGRWRHRRLDAADLTSAGGDAHGDPNAEPVPADADLTRWMAAIERVMSTRD